MKKIITLLFVLWITVALNAQTFEKIWETPSFEAPESVVAYGDFYYVSNVAGKPAEKNGQGYITKVDKNGTIITKKWSQGFNAPKGLGIYGSELFVADIDIVAIVDLKTGEIKQKLQAEGATFLNDVEVSKNGTVYITDTFGGNAIYTIKNGDISLWLKDEALDYPNGLKLRGNYLYVSTWGVVTNPETFGTEVPGKVLKIDLKTKQLIAVTSSIGNLDGLVCFGDSLVVSDWIAGGLIIVEIDGTSKEILNLQPGSADILYLEEERLVLIPQMLDGSLISYKIEE